MEKATIMINPSISYTGSDTIKEKALHIFYTRITNIKNCNKEIKKGNLEFIELKKFEVYMIESIINKIDDMIEDLKSLFIPFRDDEYCHTLETIRTYDNNGEFYIEYDESDIKAALETNLRD